MPKQLDYARGGGSQHGGTQQDSGVEAGMVHVAVEGWTDLPGDPSLALARRLQAEESTTARQYQRAGAMASSVVPSHHPGASEDASEALARRLQAEEDGESARQYQRVGAAESSIQVSDKVRP